METKTNSHAKATPFTDRPLEVRPAGRDVIAELERVVAQAKADSERPAPADPSNDEFLPTRPPSRRRR